ncbi:tryptophan-rich sensory protein [Micromonospora sp. ALFpr18c]|nr:tryptophan-rich sensory protein [Micromonospora sp. ALFpr18c]
MERSQDGATASGRRSWWALAGFAAAVFVAAAIGGLGVQGTSDEYASLRQPDWAPPSWLFGPVWTLLYALIAVAGWLVWRRVGFAGALWAWTAQLVLNAIWTPASPPAGDRGRQPVSSGARSGGSRRTRCRRTRRRCSARCRSGPRSSWCRTCR